MSLTFKFPNQPVPHPARGNPRPGNPNSFPQTQGTPRVAWRAPPARTIRIRYETEGKKEGAATPKRGGKKTSGRALLHPEGGGDSESTSSRRGKGSVSVEVLLCRHKTNLAKNTPRPNTSMKLGS